MKNAPPGFVFRATDQELVCFYLRRWIAGLSIPGDAFQECDVYAAEPDKLLGGRQQAYFFATLKPSKSSRMQRRAGLGTWMLNSCKDGEPIKAAAPGGGGTVVEGYKRNLSFHLGSVKKATGYVMDEYSLCNLADDNKGQRVVCVVRQTKNAMNRGAKRQREMLEEAAGAKRKREMLEEAASLPPSAGGSAVVSLDDDLLPFCVSHMGLSEELMLQDKEQLESEVAPSLPPSAGSSAFVSLDDDLLTFSDSLEKLLEVAPSLPLSPGVPAVAGFEDDLQRFCYSLEEQLEVAPSLPPTPGLPAVASLEDDRQRFCGSPLGPSEMMDDLRAIVEGKHRFF